jgi:hypothetical protein
LVGTRTVAPHKVKHRVGPAVGTAILIEPSYIEIQVPDESPLLVRPGPVEDGGGLVIVGGEVIMVPPWSPLLKVMEVIGVMEKARTFSGEAAQMVQRAAVMELAQRVQALHLNMVGPAAPPSRARRATKRTAKRVTSEGKPATESK